jgi:hypothetical protein
MAPTATFEDLEPSVCSSSDEEEEESCPSSKKHLQIFRTVSLDEDQKLDDNLENLKRESKHDSSWADENKPSEEIKNDEELLTEATITNNGVLIEPNKSRFEQSDSYFISDNLLASLEEPHQFLTFGGLGPIEISTSGGQIVTDETSGASTDDIQVFIYKIRSQNLFEKNILDR